MQDILKRYRNISIAAILLLTVILVIPVKVGYSIKTPGKLLAAREWVVTRGTDGRLISTLVDHRRGVNENYSVSQFERGDAVQFRFRPFVAAGVGIARGDTVGSIYSNDFERQYIELEGALAQANATLELLLSGEKQSVVQEASRSLEFARKQEEEQKKVFARVKGLYERDLISKEEFELAAGEKELDGIKVMIAEAQLQKVQSGAKSEEVGLVRARIQALGQEIGTLTKRMAQFTLVSPISGITLHVYSGDTVLVVQDTTELLLKMPVNWRQRKFVLSDQTVKLRGPDMDDEPNGKLVTVDKAVHNLGGRPVVIATAVVERYHPELVPGLILSCSIACDPILPREYLTRMVKSFLN